jgi:hypothetical protein
MIDMVEYARRICMGAVDEDRIEEMRQEWMEMKRRRRYLSCTDGFCGAEDCPRCRPGSYWFTNVDDVED